MKRIFQKKDLGLVIFIAVLIASCQQKAANEDINQTHSMQVENADTSIEIIARINDIIISEKLLDYRIQSEKAYGNNSIDHTLALIMLINDALEIAVAKRYNVLVSDDEIRELKYHSETTSKAPEILYQVKQAYGSDTLAYYNWYLAPKIVNRKLRAHFSRDKAIHLQERSKIENIYSLIKAGESFKTFETSNDLIYRKDTINNQHSQTSLELSQYQVPVEGDFKDPLISLCSKLKHEEVCNQIIDDDQSFTILKLLKKSKNEYIIERIIINKIDFDKWFKKEVRKLELQVFDINIKNSLKANYSDVWWVSFIR